MGIFFMLQNYKKSKYFINFGGFFALVYLS